MARSVLLRLALFLEPRAVAAAHQYWQHDQCSPEGGSCCADVLAGNNGAVGQACSPGCYNAVCSNLRALGYTDDETDQVTGCVSCTTNTTNTSLSVWESRHTSPSPSLPPPRGIALAPSSIGGGDAGSSSPVRQRPLPAGRPPARSAAVGRRRRRPRDRRDV